MRRPTIKELKLTISYFINPDAYGFEDKMTALATIIYCQHDKTTPEKLLEEILINSIEIKR
tara:strand:+ start:1071 stop:1253 length:183 start_codon:yes stop_codon:yes gene_type:complete